MPRDSKAPLSKTLVVSLVLSFLVTVAPLGSESAVAAPMDGSCSLVAIGGGTPGTEANPYAVANADDLWEIVDCDSTAGENFFVLTADIDASSASAGTPTQSPIGIKTGAECTANTTGTPNASFEGNLSGGSPRHSIFNVGIESNCGTALFWSLGSVLSPQTVIKDLSISGQVSSSANSNTESSLYWGNTSAGLAVKVKGNTLVSNVDLAVSISAVRKVGGVVGRVESGHLTISETARSQQIVASGDSSVLLNGQVGGLVGFVHYGANLSIVNSTNSSSVLSANLRGVGGLVGQTSQLSLNIPSILIENSVNLGAVVGYEQVGGILGYSNTSKTTVSDVVNYGAVAARDYVGGIVGFADNVLLIQNATNSGTVSAIVQSNVGAAGGILGGRGQGGTPQTVISDSTNTGEVRGNLYAGGAIGFLNEPATLSSIMNEGKVTLTGPSSNPVGAGGLIGYATTRGHTHFVGSRNLGDVESNAANSGGFVGYTAGNVSVSLGQNSGAISGSSNVGGFVGYSEGDLEVSSSANSGTISSATSYTGGILGQRAGLDDKLLRIFETSNVGSITSIGSSLTGGAIGSVSIRSRTQILSFTNSGQIISNTNQAGGIIGYLAGPLEVKNSINSGSVSATTGTGAGGLAGRLDPAASDAITISGFVNSGSIQSPSSLAGGLGRVLALGAGASVLVESAFNYGNVSKTGSGGEADAGGLIGHAYVAGAASLKITFSASASLGDVDGGQANKVGGLIGDAEAGTQLYVAESFTQGLLNGSSQIGGLVGAAVSVTIYNSYSVASVSGQSAVGGLIGQRPALFAIENSYFAGSISGQSTFDGLAGGNQSGTATSSYTITTSAFVSTSNEVELRTLSTYQNWDFDDVWSFGPCGINNQFPVLQWAEQLLFDVSCLLNQVPSQTTQSAGTNQPAESNQTPPQATGYTGPLVVLSQVYALAGSSLQLTGEKLDSVTSVEIGGVLVEVIARDATSITIELPASIEPGTYDLVISSGFGKLTVMGAVVISAAVSKTSELGELLGFSWTAAFIGNSRSLNQIQVMTIESALEKQPTATTVICWGYTTASSPNAWAIAHATQRAQAACKLVAQLNSEVKTAVRLRYGVKKSYAMRASLQFWELKPAP